MSFRFSTSSPPLARRASALMLVGIASAISLSSLDGCSGGCGQTAPTRSSAADGGSDAAAPQGMSARLLDAGTRDGDAGPHFEGTMTFETTDDVDYGEATDPNRHIHERVVSVKGDAYRWDILEKAVPRGDYRIYDHSAHYIYTVLNSEGVVLFTPDHAVAIPGKASDSIYAIQDVHEARWIDGRKCEEYLLVAPESTYGFCATGDFVPLPFDMVMGMAGVLFPFSAQLLDRGLFPLRAWRKHPPQRDAGLPPTDEAIRTAKVTANFRVVDVQPGPVDSSLFVVPKYTMKLTRELEGTDIHRR